MLATRLQSAKANAQPIPSKKSRVAAQTIKSGTATQEPAVEKQADPIGSGKVTCSALNVRQGAGTNTPRIGGLTKGKSFQVYEEKDGWLKIAYGSDYGWISKQYTDYKTPEPPKPAFEPYDVQVTANDGLRVRDIPGNGGDPDPNSGILGLLNYGTVVKVTDEKNGWFKISYDGKDGWICGDFVRKYDPSSTGAVSTNGVPLYCQGDSRWGSRGLGTGGNTIRSAGCAMCSTAMCLSKIAGREIPPDELDQYLDTHNGYSGDNIYWAKAASYIGYTASSTGMSGNKGTIDSGLEAGRPCVISVKNGGHYVCVAGKNSDGSYIIHDPGDGSIRSGSWNGSVIMVNGYTAGSQLVYFH